MNFYTWIRNRYDFGKFSHSEGMSYLFTSMLIGMVFLFLLPLLNWASETDIPHAQFISPKQSLQGKQQRVNGLKWKIPPQGLPVQKQVQPGKTIHLVTLQGRYSRKDWNLIWNGNLIQLENNGSFILPLEITAQETLLEITAISPLGEVEHEIFNIKYDKFDTAIGGNPSEQEKGMSPTDSLGLPSKNWTWAPGVGVSSISYSQTGEKAVEEIAITPKISGEYRFSPRISIGANVFSTVALLSQSDSYSVQFLGANLRAGYLPAWVQSPWKLILIGGIYYSTTFSADNTPGYHHIYGPQFFPVLSREFKNTSHASIYFKYSPISESFNFLSLSNREIATGLQYSFPRGSLGAWAITLDYSHLSLYFDAGFIKTQSLTLGAGLVF